MVSEALHLDDHIYTTTGLGYCVSGTLLAWRGWIFIFFYYADTREGKGAGLDDLLGETERIPRPASFRFCNVIDL